MVESFDMFSKLPDYLLFTILAFLPSLEDAAMAGMISKRWLRIWLTSLSMEFKEESFVGGSDKQDSTTLHVRRQLFVDFMKRWLLKLDGFVVGSCSINLSEPKEFEADMKTCVNSIVRKRVSGLALDFSEPSWENDNCDHDEDLFELPSIVYHRQKPLESLKLFSCGFSRACFITNLSTSLKHVALGFIKLETDFLVVFLEKCETLESLSLKRCTHLQHFEIKKPMHRLRSLVLDRCVFHEASLALKAPKLKSFKYSGVLANFEMEIDKDYMEEADLDFGLEPDEFYETDCLYNLLDSLYPVKVLTVCSYFLQVICSGEESSGLSEAMFVEQLTIKTDLHPNDFYGIKFLLRSCPYLEFLTFDLGHGRILSDYSPPLSLNSTTFWEDCLLLDGMFVDKCLSQTLKEVRAKGFRGTADQVRMLGFLIRSGKVLERMIIYLAIGSDGHGRNIHLFAQVAESLRSVPAASHKLSICVCL